MKPKILLSLLIGGLGAGSFFIPGFGDLMANPAVRYALLQVVGLTLRIWPRFVNEAIPFYTGILNVVTYFGGLLGVEAAHAGAISPAAVDQTFSVIDLVVPWVSQAGAYNVVKKMWQWYRDCRLKVDAKS